MSQTYTGDLSKGTLEPSAEATDRPIKELLIELWENTETLVRQELKLASAELDEKVTKAKKDLTKTVIGGAALYAGGLAIRAALILFLANFMAPWFAALLVGANVLAVGYTLAQRAKQLSPDKLVPHRTIENVREDVQTFREATK
jgi:hypothetical protein